MCTRTSWRAFTCTTNKIVPDWDFYLNVYHGGTIPPEEWPQYRARAKDQLGRYKRSYTVSAPAPDSEAMAVCAMAEALYSFDLLAGGQGGPVQSASIGSVSASYGSSAAQSIDLSPKGQARELYRCASLFLDIYRGVG